MTLSIQPCDLSNRDEIINLSVFDSQKNFIETNADSLKEADEFNFWRPCGLYDDRKLIGFAMYGKIPDDETVWLDRFMIAKEFQKLGYGKKIIPLILKKIIDEYHCDKIYMSYTPQNIVMASYCRQFGFEETGEIDPNGEIIMSLDSTSNYKLI